MSPSKKRWLIGGSLVAVTLAGLAKLAAPEREPRREKTEDPEVPPPSGTGSKWPKPLLVAKRGNPELEALLAELGTFLAQRGVDTKVVSAAELTVMPKTPGPHYAIPDRSMWGNIVGASKLVMEVRDELGFPLYLSGFRPADYNKAVGGAPKSQHVGFRAIDFRPAAEHNNSANRRKLGLVAARIYQSRPTEKIGLGIYSYPVPSNGHFDTGYARRTWEETNKFLADIANA